MRPGRSATKRRSLPAALAMSSGSKKFSLGKGASWAEGGGGCGVALSPHGGISTSRSPKSSCAGSRLSSMLLTFFVGREVYHVTRWATDRCEGRIDHAASGRNPGTGRGPWQERSAADHRRGPLGGGP